MTAYIPTRAGFLYSSCSPRTALLSSFSSPDRPLPLQCAEAGPPPSHVLRPGVASRRSASRPTRAPADSLAGVPPSASVPAGVPLCRKGMERAGLPVPEEVSPPLTQRAANEGRGTPRDTTEGLHLDQTRSDHSNPYHMDSLEEFIFRPSDWVSNWRPMQLRRYIIYHWDGRRGKWYTDTVTLPRTARLYLLSGRAEGTQHMLHVKPCMHVVMMRRRWGQIPGRGRPVSGMCASHANAAGVAQPHEGRSFRRQAPA